MIYNIRLWVSNYLMRLALRINPDISRLVKEITERQKSMGIAYMLAGVDTNEKKKT